MSTLPSWIKPGAPVIVTGGLIRPAEDIQFSAVIKNVGKRYITLVDQTMRFTLDDLTCREGTRVYTRVWTLRPPVEVE